MRGQSITLSKPAAMLLLFCLPTLSFADVEKSDTSCLICHKYPGLGRIERLGPNGKEIARRIFYVNEELFDESYHGAIPCKGCHVGVTKIPHTDVAKVDCTTDCHITDPSVGKPFSHRKIADDLRHSAHGELGTKSKEHTEDLPMCKDCHTNKIYHAPNEGRNGDMVFLNVCNECHGSRDFVKRFYEHITYRTTKRRSSREVVALCSRCHANQGLVSDHNLDAVLGFTGTFHGKAIFYGDEKVANCLNCHAPYEEGFSPHRIISRTNENSPVSEKNKLTTCRQSGCHVSASERFAAESRVHPSPEQIRILARSLIEQRKQEAGEESTTTVANGELATGVDLDRKAALQAWIIRAIKWFYRVLILLVIGGLGLHRLLDMYAARRERSIRGH